MTNQILKSTTKTAALGAVLALSLSAILSLFEGPARLGLAFLICVTAACFVKGSSK
jgi:hypothetical protein